MMSCAIGDRVQDKLGGYNGFGLWWYDGRRRLSLARRRGSPGLLAMVMVVVVVGLFSRRSCRCTAFKILKLSSCSRR